ncbi:hypothetical protein GGX14DRAFT_463929 [Mycena pura]|uniref:Zinc-finger domain-containing protein n=1 Tax=Mycena pura TaxID=153505 RepID=A0AAD6V421_9AGAR|nr:hypothetical protein GGX14DRAFT_463929 [Mycena pura]
MDSSTPPILQPSGGKINASAVPGPNGDDTTRDTPRTTHPYANIPLSNSSDILFSPSNGPPVQSFLKTNLPYASNGIPHTPLSPSLHFGTPDGILTTATTFATRPDCPRDTSSGSPNPMDMNGQSPTRIRPPIQMQVRSAHNIPPAFLSPFSTLSSALGPSPSSPVASPGAPPTAPGGSSMPILQTTTHAPDTPPRTRDASNLAHNTLSSPSASSWTGSASPYPSRAVERNTNPVVGSLFGAPGALLAPTKPHSRDARSSLAAWDSLSLVPPAQASPLSSLSSLSPRSADARRGGAVAAPTDRMEVSSPSPLRGPAPGSSAMASTCPVGTGSKNSEKNGHQPFISSPEPPNVHSVHDLFTPPPESVAETEPLFTPRSSPLLASRSSIPLRKTDSAIIGKRKAAETAAVLPSPGKRRRMIMDYVRVPTAPYRLTPERERGREVGRVGRVYGARNSAAEGPQRQKVRARARRASGSNERPLALHSKRDVHPSLSDALNHAWAHNEREGTIPVGGMVVHKKRKQGRKKREHRESDEDQEGLADTKRAQRTRSGEREQGQVMEKIAEHPQWSWCAEMDNVTRLFFDMPVAEADRLSCVSLQLAYGKLLATTFVPQTLRPQKPCLVWSKRGVGEEEDEEVTPGGSVLEFCQSEEKIRHELPQGERNGTRMKQAVDGVTEDRVAQRKKDQSPEEFVLGQASSRDTVAEFSQPELDDTSSIAQESSPQLHGARISLTPLSQTDSDVDDAPVVLSAKAKGKQRALNDDAVPPSPEAENFYGASLTWIHQSANRGRPSSSPEQSSATQNMNGLFGGHVRPTSQLQASNFQISPPGLDCYPLVPPTTSADSFYPPVLSPSDNPLLPGADEQLYGDGTIDPSLLGGGMMEPDEAYENDNDDVQMGQEAGNEIEHEVEDVRMSSPASSDSSSSLYELPLAQRLPTRRRVQRRAPEGMVRTDLLSSDESSLSSSASSGDESEFYSPPAIKSSSKLTSKPGQPSVEIRASNGSAPTAFDVDRFFRYSGPPWPRGDPGNFCHQCRSRSKYLTMTFDKCTHAFCVRCVMLKYPPGTVAFECESTTENCVRCRDICTCDMCTTRRGETYHSSSRRKPAPRVPSYHPSSKRPKVPSYPGLETMAIEPTTYYATMYNFDGIPVAHTYLGADGNDQVVVACPVPNNIRRRVFIGAVQESWGLGPKPAVYIDPPRRPERNINKTKRRREKQYIGNKTPLFLPVRSRPPHAAQASELAPIPTLALAGDANALTDNEEVALTPLSLAPGDETVAESALTPVSGDLDPDSDCSSLSSLEPDGQGELLHWLFPDAADGGSVQKRQRSKSCGLSEAAAGKAGSGLALSDNVLADVIYSALKAAGATPIMAIEPSL